MAKRRRGRTANPQPQTTSSADRPRAARRAADRSARAAGTPAGRHPPPRRSLWPWFGLGGVAVVLVALLATGSLSGNAAAPDGSGSPGPATGSPAATDGLPGATATFDPVGTAPIGEVRCDPIEGAVSHIHAHLALRWDGTEFPIPPDVGIRGSCLYWLHTHASAGILHVEAPVRQTFTLGDFFAVWGLPLDGTHVADRVVGAGEQVFAFVDGEAFGGDPAEILLADLEAIELQVGTSPLIPLGYTFPPDFL
jgi:hypothetical protein